LVGSLANYILEGRGGVGLMFAGMRARIEAAGPLARIGVMRIAGALCNIVPA
jgi:hypothetical protein